MPRSAGTWARELAKHAARRVGLDLTRTSINPERHWERFLLESRPDLLVDVGANVGQWAGRARAAGCVAPIISFEPVRAAFDALTTAAAGDALWSVQQVAVGDEAGTVPIHVAGNSFSSSLLPMLDTHDAEAPDSSVMHTEEVAVRRLDELLAGRSFERAYLKIDTQGYELRALLGSGDLLDRCVGVELELSMVPLYDGAPSQHELTRYMEQHGFLPLLSFPVFWASSHPQLLQTDVVFCPEATFTGQGWPVPHRLGT